MRLCIYYYANVLRLYVFHNINEILNDCRFISAYIYTYYNIRVL